MTRAIMLLALAAAAALTSAPAFASPDDLATIERECGVQLKLPAGACACLCEHASKLKDGQQAFIAAVVNKDKPAQNEFMQNLTVAELTEAGMFMASTPMKCVGG